MEKDPTVVKYGKPSNERYTKIYKKYSAMNRGIIRNLALKST